MANNTNNFSNINNAPTLRSRNSVIKGSRAFWWDREMIRTDQPYYDHRFHIPFNEPPKEINFVEGVGATKGNKRSKLHPNRPTVLQQIFGMKNRNKIVTCFTQPSTDVNSCNLKIRDKLEKPTTAIKQIKKIVGRISAADVVNSPSSSVSGSDSSEIVRQMLTSKKKKTTDEDCKFEDMKINGIPFYYAKDEIQNRQHEFLKKNIVDDIEFPEIPHREEVNFKEWALNERAKYKIHKGLNISPAVAAAIDESDDNSQKSDGKVSPSQKSSYRSRYLRRQQRFNHKNVIKHISGYMYGPFTRHPTPDKLTKKGDKFGIPFTMTNRAERYYKKKKIQHNVLRRVRLSHMGFEQPPSEDASSDDESSVQMVKKLALIRTPYFIVPTIKISHVRKKDRFRNKYLKKDRLKRVNLLLNEASRKRHKKATEADEEDNIQKKQSIFSRFFKLTGKKFRQVTEQPQAEQPNPEKAKYYKIIKEKYLEHRSLCEILNQAIKPVTFKDYKKQLKSNEPENSAFSILNLDSVTAKQSNLDIATDRTKTSFKSRFKINPPKELFKKKKNEKLSKYDEIVGPFYIDPNLMDKFRSPKKFKKLHKYYTNLIKSKFWTRDRLQVNAPKLDEEKIGISNEKKYYHRLATEWDEYYIHELRNRPPAKKFCVKTDILTLRQIAKKNYIMYYVQENLLDLQAQQKQEEQLMDNVEAFQKHCQELFIKWKADAFNHVADNHSRLKEIQSEIKSLLIEKSMLDDTWTEFSKDLYETEQRWNFLLMLQNYYYLVQNSEWREENDWIHRNPENNELQPAILAASFCKQRNIRPQTDCLAHSIKEFFYVNLRHKLEKMKTIVPDADLLLKSLTVHKQKTISGLIQHNRTFWIYKEILAMFNKLNVEMQEHTIKHEKQIEIMKEKAKFIANRSKIIETESKKVAETLLPKAVENLIERKITAISDQLHTTLSVSEIGSTLSANNILNKAVDFCNGGNAAVNDKFGQIQKFALDLLQQLDDIPIDILKASEKATLEKRKLEKEETRNAMIKQKRFDLMKKQLRNQFLPAAKFKRVKVTVCRKPITEDTTVIKS